jgi:hypothetical protein
VWPQIYTTVVRGNRSYKWEMSHFGAALSMDISLLPLITIGYTSVYLRDPVLTRRWHSETMVNNTNTA